MPSVLDALMSGNYLNDGTWVGAGPPPAGYVRPQPLNYDDRTSLYDMLYAPTLDQKIAAFTKAVGYAPTGNALAVLGGGGGGQPAPAPTATPTAATIITDPVLPPPPASLPAPAAAPQAPNPNAAPLNTPFTVAPPAIPIPDLIIDPSRAPSSAMPTQGVSYGGPNVGGLGGLGSINKNIGMPDQLNRLGRDNSGQPSSAPNYTAGVPGAWNTNWGNFRAQQQQGPMPMSAPALGRGWGSGGY